MGRIARYGIALVTSALLLGPGCSAGNGDTSGAGGSASTTSALAESTPTTTAASGETAGSTPDGPVDVTDPAADPGAATTVVAPPVADAGGWQLVVSYPIGGSSVGRVALLCYQVTGSSRASAIGLEVTAGTGAPVRVAGSVGRGSAHVDLGAAGYDPQDVRVQLLVDGARIDGAAVTIPGVLVVPAATDPDCP